MLVPSFRSCAIKLDQKSPGPLFLYLPTACIVTVGPNGYPVHL